MRLSLTGLVHKTLLRKGCYIDKETGKDSSKKTDILLETFGYIISNPMKMYRRIRKRVLKRAKIEYNNIYRRLINNSPEFNLSSQSLYLQNEEQKVS